MNDSANNLGQIKAVSFDLDDTLWDCEPVILHAEQTLYQWFANHTPRIAASCAIGDIQARRMDFANGHPEYRADVTFLRRESIKSLLSEFAYSRDLVDAAFDCFYQARSEVDLYTEAVPMLESLKNNYKIAAVTNGNADLSLIGIDHLFDDIQLATLTNSPKPHRTMFDNAASALDVSLHEIIHIGDNPATDVGGGQAAGTMTVWFNQHRQTWPAERPAADFEIHTLSALTELLEKKT